MSVNPLIVSKHDLLWDLFQMFFACDKKRLYF